jgi:hypothetical protein
MAPVPVPNLPSIDNGHRQLPTGDSMADKDEALEAWRRAVRDLDATTPWTAEWLRARMIEEDRRLAYLELADDIFDHESVASVTARPGPSARPARR